MTRRYTLRQRATRQAETRQRILDAAIALHGSIGPARTTISTVAARAGVQRLTVYHHFGDEGALFAACSGQWAAQNPPPDATIWARIAEPALRLRTALTALFAYWRRVEAMMVNILRDRTLAPAVQAAAADAAVYGSGVRVCRWNYGFRVRLHDAGSG